MYAALIGAAVNMLQQKKEKEQQANQNYRNAIGDANSGANNAIGSIVSRGRYTGNGPRTHGQVLPDQGNAAIGAGIQALAGLEGAKESPVSGGVTEGSVDELGKDVGGGMPSIAQREVYENPSLVPQQGSILGDPDEDKWKSKLSLLGGAY